MPFNESIEGLAQPLIWNPNQLQGTDLTITTKNGTWVDLIFIVTNTGGLQPPHPIHKHSNKAHIIVSFPHSFLSPLISISKKRCDFGSK